MSLGQIGAPSSRTWSTLRQSRRSTLHRSSSESDDPSRAIRPGTPAGPRTQAFDTCSVMGQGFTFAVVPEFASVVEFEPRTFQLRSVTPSAQPSYRKKDKGRNESAVFEATSRLTTTGFKLLSFRKPQISIFNVYRIIGTNPKF